MLTAKSAAYPGMTRADAVDEKAFVEECQLVIAKYAIASQPQVSREATQSCVVHFFHMCMYVDLPQAMWDDVTWVGKAAINISALLNGRLKVPQMSIVALTCRTML
jgi:hypothetical protein